MDDQTKPDQPTPSPQQDGAPVPPPPPGSQPVSQPAEAGATSAQPPAPDGQPFGAAQVQIPGQPQVPGQPDVPVAPQSPYASQPGVSGQQAAGYYQPAAPQSSGKAIGALVCGIFAILLSWTVLPSIILGIVAIVLAVKAVKEAGKDGKATGGKVCGIIGIVFSVITLILYLVTGLAMMAYVNDYYDAPAYSSSSTTAPSTPSMPESGSDEQAMAEAAVAVKLDLLLAKDSAIVQELAQKANSEVADATDYGLSDLGVDPVAFAEWMLTDFSYELDGVYVNGDGTATAFADVTLRDSLAFANTFVTDAQAAIDAGEMQTMDEAAAKARLGEIYQAAMDKSTDMTTSYINLDLVKVGDAWQVDEGSWESELDYLFGM